MIKIPEYLALQDVPGSFCGCMAAKAAAEDKQRKPGRDAVIGLTVS